MKLIDADILERSLTEIDEHINMDIFTNEVRELIDNTPTIEAIPRERIEQMLEHYKLRMPPTVYYDLLADVRNYGEEQNNESDN